MENAFLLDFLACPREGSDLIHKDGFLVCMACEVSYPIVDEVVCFLSPRDLTEAERKEQQSRDEEAGWYDSIFEGYPNAVEVPTVIRRIGTPTGLVLDHGSGTGRIAEALTELGQPVIALDYSLGSLRKLVARCSGAPVLAVQADVRSLPIRDGVVHAVTSMGVYVHLRDPEDRHRELRELARVMRPGSPLSLATLNYSAVFRAWRLLGNKGAKEGDHLMGGDFYYLRLTEEELRRELEGVFDVEELVGIRNIPTRSLAGLIRRAGLRTGADRFLEWMANKGPRFDWALERTPLSAWLGFYWLARARRRAAAG